MSNETRPRMLQTSWHKVKLAMEKTGIKDRNEAIQAVADGYMNAASEIEEERKVFGEAFDKLVKSHNKKIRAYKKEKQFLATCLTVSISSGFILLGILGSVKGWW